MWTDHWEWDNAKCYNKSILIRPHWEKSTSFTSFFIDSWLAHGCDRLLVINFFLMFFSFEIYVEILIRSQYFWVRYLMSKLGLPVSLAKKIPSFSVSLWQITHALPNPLFGKIFLLTGKKLGIRKMERMRCLYKNEKMAICRRRSH